MAAISAKDIQRLRQVAGVGMMESKKALEEADGDVDAALKILRERGLANMAKRSDRANEQGAVAVAHSGNAAAIAQLKCETDFVAKSPDFVTLVAAVAETVASEGTGGAAKHQEAIDSLRISLKENVVLGRVVHFDAPAGSIVDTYLHVQAERGVNATMVELANGAVETAHEVALHIAFARPQYLTRGEVPADLIEEERKTLEAMTRNEGKPEAALPKIVEGRMNGFFKDRCLLEQVWAKDNKQTIKQMLGGATITRFAQIEIGR